MQYYCKLLYYRVVDIFVVFVCLTPVPFVGLTAVEQVCLISWPSG